MRVKIFNMSATFDNHELVGEADVTECFPDDPLELSRAIQFLNINGEYVTGGGAAPMMLLEKIGP